jgi:hypothetical protein
MLPAVPCLRLGTVPNLPAAVGMVHSRMWFLRVQAGSVLFAGTAVMSSLVTRHLFSSSSVFHHSYVYSISMVVRRRLFSLMAADGEVVELLLRDVVPLWPLTDGVVVGLLWDVALLHGVIGGRGGGRVVGGVIRG